MFYLMYFKEKMIRRTLLPFRRILLILGQQRIHVKRMELLNLMNQRMAILLL